MSLDALFIRVYLHLQICIVSIVILLETYVLNNLVINYYAPMNHLTMNLTMVLKLITK